jgi:hypothetical protein
MRLLYIYYMLKTTMNHIASHRRTLRLEHTVYWGIKSYLQVYVIHQRLSHGHPCTVSGYRSRARAVSEQRASPLIPHNDSTWDSCPGLPESPFLSHCNVLTNSWLRLPTWHPRRFGRIARLCGDLQRRRSEHVNSCDERCKFIAIRITREPLMFASSSRDAKRLEQKN